MSGQKINDMKCKQCGYAHPIGTPCPPNSSFAAPTGLGVNRVGTKILGIAWGEQDRPDAALLASAAEVRNFIVEEWIGDRDDALVEQVMQELAAHNWEDDREIKWTFEVGGLSLQDVYDMTPNDQAQRPG